MTKSGLIVFLPLVGAILGGIIGAVGGAWANSWYRDREAKKAEDQERKGLLSLINAELADHWIVFFAGAVGPADVAARLSTDCWDRSKTTLARLLPADDVFELVKYYSRINQWRERYRFSADPGFTDDQNRDRDEIDAQAIRVWEVASKYVDDPMAFKHMFHEDRQIEEAADNDPG